MVGFANESASNLSIPDEVAFKGYTAVLSIVDSCEPTSFKATVSQFHWRAAMTDEFQALQKQGTWELVPAPSNRNIIGSKWVDKIKKDQNRAISRYKAHLVAQGYSQEQGLNYDDTFNHVVKHSTIRIVLALAAA